MKFFVYMLVLFSFSQMGHGNEAPEGDDFICDVEMLNCRVVDSDMAIGDSVGFFDKEGKLYAIGEVVKLEVGFREIEIIQLFSAISPDAQFRVISDDERKSALLDKHHYLPNYFVGASVGYKRMALVDSLAGFNCGVYLARRIHKHMAVFIRSDYAYVDAVIEREEIDERHTFDVQAALMSFYSGVAYEVFPQHYLSPLLELGAGIAAVNTARPDGVKIDEDIAGMHLLLQATLGVQLNVQNWRLQAGIVQSLVGNTGAHTFAATLARGI